MPKSTGPQVMVNGGRVLGAFPSAGARRNDLVFGHGPTGAETVSETVRFPAGGNNVNLEESISFKRP